MTDAAIERRAHDLVATARLGYQDQAIAQVTALLQRVKALESALEPFDQALENAEGSEPGAGTVWESAAAMSITFDDLRRARAAINIQVSHD